MTTEKDSEKCEKDCEAPSPSSPADNVTSVQMLWKLLWDADASVLLLLAFLQSYFQVSYNLWIPLFVVEAQHDTSTTINVILTGLSISAIVTMFIFAWLRPSTKSIFYVALCAQVMFIVFEAIFLIFWWRLVDRVGNIFLWAIFVAIYGIPIIVEEVFLVSTLAKLVTSRHQIMTDSIRLIFYRLGAECATLTSGVLYRCFDFVVPVHVCVIFAALCLLVMRRRTYQDPKLVIR